MFLKQISLSFVVTNLLFLIPYVFNFHLLVGTNSEWENGKYHGVGECRWSDGRSYRGEWKDGRANGYGVETRPNGTIRHDGEWKEDRPIRESKKKSSDEKKSDAAK